MAGVEIALIGAGSGQFSLGVIRDLVCIPSLKGSRVRLMDIDEARLDTICALAERYVAEVGAEVSFSKTLDRQEALAGVDFVLNCALVGGWRGRRYLDEILKKYNCPGGLRAGTRVLGSFKQLDLFASIVKEMEQLCPDAWYVQSANPMTSGITLVSRMSTIKTVGLCHGFNDIFNIANRIGLDRDKVTAQAYGLNHFIWLKSFNCGGKDAYPVLDEWIEKSSEEFWKSDECAPSHPLGPKAVELYRMLGMYPIGDTCTPGGGNWPDWFRKTPEMVEQWNEDTGAWIERHINWVTERAGEFAELVADESASAVERYPAEPTGETNVTIMDALTNDTGGIFQVNVLNQGAIGGIADDIAVELPAYVSRAGIQRFALDPLPESIMHFVRQRALVVRQEVETYLSRSRCRLLLAILADLNIGIDQANGLLDEVLSHPNNQDMAAHFV